MRVLGAKQERPRGVVSTWCGKTSMCPALSPPRGQPRDWAPRGSQERHRVMCVVSMDAGSTQRHVWGGICEKDLEAYGGVWRIAMEEEKAVVNPAAK